MTDVAGPSANRERGLLSWVFSMDHRRISVMQLGGIGLAFAIGGAFAVLLQLTQAVPEAAPLRGSGFESSLTFHGLIMLFFVAVPGIGATFGGYVLPDQIGARGLAFNRLYLLSFHLWVAAAALLGTSWLGGAGAGVR